MSDTIEEKTIADDFNLPVSREPTENSEDMTYEQLEDLKTLIKLAKRMNKGGFRKCIPNGIRGLLFKSRQHDKDQAVRIDPQIWTAFLKYNIKLNVEITPKF